MHVAWQTIDAVLQRMTDDLDRDWTLAALARLAGYDDHHFAHRFKERVGHPPLHYLRLLRLERAAHRLQQDAGATIFDTALATGFESPEAFTRAFRRAFGRAPTQIRGGARRVVVGPAPAGLGEATIAVVGPLAALSVIVPSFSMEDCAAGYQTLLDAMPLDGPWQIGGVAQPWGFTEAGTALRELRLVRYVEEAPRVAEPLRAWRMPAACALVREYVGALDGVAAACTWAATVAAAGPDTRMAFAPVITRLEGLGADVVRCQIIVPVEPQERPGAAIHDPRR